MKAKYHTRKNELRHQPDHITPKKFNYLKKMVLIVIMLDCS